jgi:AraC family transcriptional activator FtrA
VALRDLRRVAALVYDGLGTFEFGIVVELFGLRRTGLGVTWYQFEACSVEHGSVWAAGGIQAKMQRGLWVFEEAGTILIPGWKIDEPVPPALIRALRRAHSDGARLVSICSGVFVLAATGLLDGKRVTAQWRHATRLISAVPEPARGAARAVCRRRQQLEIGGSTAGIDLGLHIIRLDYGAGIANEIARRLMMPPHREGGQRNIFGIRYAVR